MVSWEPAISSLLHLFRLDSIKSKVLVFALLTTLIPSLTLGLQSYVLNKQFITEKISGELRNATFHMVREFDLWLKERFYEMRVFSNSYEVTENLEKMLNTPEARITEARRRLTDYLKSVRGKFPDYERVIPQNHTKTIKLAREGLLHSLQRVAILTNEKFRGVRLVIGAGSLKIISTNAEQEEAQEEIEIDYSGETLDIGFNVTYLLDVLNNLNCESIECRLADSNSSALFMLPEQQNFKYVVMPMRI